MLDQSRTHGDSRYADQQRLVTPVWELLPAERRERTLSWALLFARFFPTRRRYDVEALAAHGAYPNVSRLRVERIKLDGADVSANWKRLGKRARDAGARPTACARAARA